MTAKMHRRQLLRRTAGTAFAAVPMFGPVFVPATALGRAGRIAPSERIAIGCIGVGNMGSGDMNALMNQPGTQIVAVCDVKRAMRDRAVQAVDAFYGKPGCAAYNDFREFLDRPDIDAVNIATLDTWHVLHAMAAVRAGKDVYVEKPLGMSIDEIKVLRRAIHRYGRVFQFGTQQRSSQEFRFCCELVRNGRIGKLHTIVVGSVPGAELANQPLQPEPDPKDFDYNMWLGPAPWAPYTFQRSASRAEGTPGYWMHIHDYCLGCLSGAWGIHHVDIAQWGNNTDDTGPLEIAGTGVIPSDGLCDTPVTWRVEHVYANGVRMIHMDSRHTEKEFPQFVTPVLETRGCGILFIGTDGWVIVSRGGIDANPKSLLQTTFSSSEPRLPVSNDHKRNFLECVRSRQKTICPIETAVRSDTICHLDDIAIRLGRKLHWDPVMEQFVSDEQANRLLTRPVRSPWQL
jgi:predicted dehydrogenase